MKVLININNEDFKSILEITKKRLPEFKNPDYGACIETFIIWQVKYVKENIERMKIAAERIKNIPLKKTKNSVRSIK